jgi:hypothetical protein
VISHDRHRICCVVVTQARRDASANKVRGTPSDLRLDEVSKNLLVQEILGKARWITEGLYSREGDA